MSTYKKSYALRVDETVFAKLKVISGFNHRSVNSQIEALIEQCISVYEEEHGEISVETTE